MKINKPKIRYTNKATFENATINNIYSNLHIKGTEENILLNDITLDSCIFENIDFTTYKINDIDLIDCILTNCDLSNISSVKIIYYSTNF